MLHKLAPAARSGAALRNRARRWLGTAVVYALLIEFVFVFLYPFLYMLLNSFKFDTDFRDLNRQWVLSGLNFENYTNALSLLHYGGALSVNLLVAVLSTLGHVLSCSFIAYGVSHFRFRGNRIVFALIILSILVPPQLLSMPLYIQFSKLHMIGTILPIVLPSFFGFGLRGGLFIFIFMQFFKGIPKSYEESARLEGCSSRGVYLRIMMPMSKTSMLVVGTLSTIWHWNDTYEPAAYLNASAKTLSQMLDILPAYLYQSITSTGVIISPVQLAACVLIVLPLLILFAVVQKQFMAGMEFSGLANS